MCNNITIRIKNVISKIRYKSGWSFRIGEKNGIAFIQVSVDKTVGRCSLTGEPVSWRGGKRFLSEWMTEQELVGVCFDAIKSAEEHEMREFFRYNGASIYNPHLSPDALVDVASKKHNFNCREDGDSMKMDN